MICINGFANSLTKRGIARPVSRARAPDRPPREIISSGRGGGRGLVPGSLFSPGCSLRDDRLIFALSFSSSMIPRSMRQTGFQSRSFISLLDSGALSQEKERISFLFLDGKAASFFFFIFICFFGNRNYNWQISQNDRKHENSNGSNLYPFNSCGSLSQRVPR